MAIIPEKYTRLTPLQEEYREFWRKFNELSLHHSAFSSTFKIHPIPSIRCYQDYSVGQSYILTLKIDLKKNLFYASAYFHNIPKYIEYCEKHKIRIESELGYELEWKQHLTAGYAKRSFTADLFDKNKHDSICKQMMDEGLRFISIFNKYSER